MKTRLNILPAPIIAQKPVTQSYKLSF